MSTSCLPLTGEWLDFPNEHIPDMAEPGIFQASPGYFVPKLGFGIVWHQHLGGPDSLLGWALEEEYWPGMQVQDFENGHLFELEGVIYLLNASDRRWFTPDLKRRSVPFFYQLAGAEGEETDKSAYWPFPGS